MVEVLEVQEVVEVQEMEGVTDAVEEAAPTLTRAVEITYTHRLCCRKPERPLTQTHNQSDEHAITQSTPRSLSQSTLSDSSIPPALYCTVASPLSTLSTWPPAPPVPSSQLSHPRRAPSRACALRSSWAQAVRRRWFGRTARC